MTGLFWTYENLCDIVPRLTQHSSSPTNAIDLNPIIKRILAICPDGAIFAMGGHSVLLSITEDIAAKVSLKSDDPHLRHEQTIMRLLDGWMLELSAAAADLEALGYAHGDINPRNILWDDDELKLVDFNHALKIGEDVEVGYEPYVRAQKCGTQGGSYGTAGPVTE